MFIFIFFPCLYLTNDLQHYSGVSIWLLHFKLLFSISAWLWVAFKRRKAYCTHWRAVQTRSTTDEFSTRRNEGWSLSFDHDSCLPKLYQGTLIYVNLFRRDHLFFLSLEKNKSNYRILFSYFRAPKTSLTLLGGLLFG